MTRVEFTIDGSTFLLSRLAKTGGCALSYHGGVQQTTDGKYVFVTVTEGDVKAVTEAAADLAGIEEVNQITTDTTTAGVLQLRLTQPFLALELADHGAIFQEATATPNTTALVIDIPENVSIQNITQLVQETFSRVELTRKQSLEQKTDHGLYARFMEELTDRQLEVMQTAYYGGFFESPRENTGEEIAETLGISPPAFYQHIRAIQRKLFATIVEDDDVQLSAQSSGVE